MRFYVACIARTMALITLIGGITFASSVQESTPQDNTKMNKRDRDKSEPTADQQKENRSDRDLAKSVRKAITDDKSLSSYAHNVKVIAQNGTVILKGPVRSEEEKKAIESKAAEVAGASNITSEITVQPDQKSR
jgi:hyperosmotically inducible protein